MKHEGTGDGDAPASRGEERAALSEALDLVAPGTVLRDSLGPRLKVRSLILEGVPDEELVRATREGEAQALFVGRADPGTSNPLTVSGAIGGWRRNHAGDRDGFYLEDGTEVRFPPHRSDEIETVAREGVPVEVWGGWRAGHVHAYRITDPASESSAEAHEPPGAEPGRYPPGRTARFVTDHATCDVVLVW